MADAPPPPAQDPTQMPPPVIEPFTYGMFTWTNVHPPVHIPAFSQYLESLTLTFTGIAQVVTNEADLRTVTILMLASMAVSVGARVVLGTEITLDKFQDAEADPWTQTPLHERFVELIKPNTRVPSAVGIKRTDLTIWSPAYKTAGLIAEYKYLRHPKCLERRYLRAVFREAVFQGLWYLGGAYQQCGTRLSLIIVNAQFMRMLIAGAAVVIEVPDALIGASAAIDSIDAFNTWDEFWDSPPAHNLVAADGTVDLAAVDAYWSTFRQGFMHTAALIHGHLLRDRVLETQRTGAQFVFDVDAKLRAAQLKKECEAASKSARSSRVATPNRSPGSSPSTGRLNRAPPSASPASPSPSGPQDSRLAANARRADRAKRRDAKRDGADDTMAVQDDDGDGEEDVPELYPSAYDDDADDDDADDDEELIDAHDVLPELATAVSTVFPKVRFAGTDEINRLMAGVVLTDASDAAD